MNFREQAEAYMLEIANRKRNPAKANTLHVYRSILDSRLLPLIGETELGEVNNKTAKMLVGRLAEAQLSPATINLAVGLMKQIVKSAVDEDGNQLYPRNWNSTFIDLPQVDPSSQKAPICTGEQITKILRMLNREMRALIALLCGTGLRIGEALALSQFDDGVSNYWDKTTGTVLIRATMVDGKLQTSPKTTAGSRQVDLDPSLNALLRSQFANCESRMLFPLSEGTYRNRLAKLGIPGFHSMRRFRITHLDSVNVPTGLKKFWAGHAAGDVTERYTKVGANLDERKKWGESAGLGFQL